MIDLGTFSREQLQAMAEAGREVTECHRVLVKTGDNVVGELLPSEGVFYGYDHCPPGDIYEHEAHSGARPKASAPLSNPRPIP